MSSPAGQAAVSPSSLADVDPALNLAESSYPWRGDPPAAAAPPTVPRVPFRPVPSANFHAEWSPGGTPGFRIGNTSFRLGQPLTHRQLLDFQAYAQDLVQELQLSHQALTSRDAELQAEVQQLKQQVVELLLRLERSQVEADDLSALMDDKDRALRELRGRWEAAERQLHAQLEETARHAAQLEELNGRLADSVKEPARKPSTSPPDLAEQVRRLAGLQRAVEAQLRAGSEPEALLEQARGEIEDLRVELMGTTQLKEIIGRELSNWMTLVANHTEAMHPLLSAHDRRLRGLWEGYGMPPLEVTPSSPRIDPSVGQFNQQMALLHDLRTQVSAWSQPMEEMLSLMPPGASLSIRSANGGLNVGVKMKLLQAKPTPAAPRTEPPRPPAELRVPQLPPPPPPPVPVEPSQPAAEPTPPPRPLPAPTRVDAATQTSPTPTPPTPPDDDPVALKQQLRMAQARATVYQAEHVQLQALASGLERRLRARLLGAAAAADRPAGSPGAVGTWEAPGDVRERLEAVTQLVEEWPIPTPPSRTASPCPSSPQRSPPTRQGMRLRCPVCHTVQPVQPATPPDATTTLEPDACAAPGAAPSNPKEPVEGAQASSSTPDVAAADAETAVLAPTVSAASRLAHTPSDAAEEVPVAVLTLQQLVEGTDVEPDDPFQPSLPVDPSSSEHPSGSLRLFYAALDPALSAPASDAPVPLPLNEDPPAPPASTLAPHHDEDRLKEQLGYVEGWFRRKARLAGATTPPATAAEEPAAPAAPGLEATPAVPRTPHHWFSGQVERIAGLVATLREAEAEAEAGPPTVPPPPEDEARLKEQLGIVEGWFHHKARLAGATTPPATAAEEPAAPAAPGSEATPAVPGTPHHWFSGQVERIAGLVTALKEAEAEAEAEPPAVPPPREDEARLKEQLGIVEGWFHRKARLAGATTPPATAAEEPAAPAAPGSEAGAAPAVPGTPHHWFSGQVDRIAGLVAALREAEAAPPTAEEGNLFSLPPVLVDTNATNAGAGNKSDLLDSQTSVKFLDVQPPSHRSSGALPPSEGAASEAEVPEAQFQKCLSELGTMSPAKVRLNLLISNMEEAIHRLAPTHPSDREISVFGGMEPERGAPSPNSGNSIVGRLKNLAEKVESNFQKSGEIEPEDLYTVPSLPSCGNLSEGQHRESGSFEGPMSDAVRLLLDIEDVVWRKMGSASVEDVANPPAADTLHTVSSVRSAVSPVQEMADRLRAVARLVSTTTAPAPDNSPSPSPVCVMEAPLSRERSFEDVSVVPSVSQPDVTIPPAPAPPAPAAPPQPPTPPTISVAPATIIGTAASTTATPPATPAPAAAAGSPPPSPPPAGQAADDLVDQIVRRIEETLRASGKQPTPVVDAARSPVSPPATPPPVLHRLQSIVRLLSPAPSSPAVEPAIPAGDDHASPDTGGATEVPVLDLVTSPAATSADASAAATAPGPTAAADPPAAPASPALEERRQLDAVLGALEQLVRSKAGGEPAPATTEPPSSSPVDPSTGPLPEAPAPDAPEAPEATGDTIVGRLETLAHLIHSWVAAEPASSSQTKVEPGVAVGSEPEQPADNAPTAVEAPSADPEQPCLPQPPMPQPSPLAPSTYLGIEISREDLETGAGLANGQAQSRKGLTVAGVRGPAELAGLKPKDIVMQVDDQPTNSVADFAVVARGLTPGQVVAVHVLRGLTIAVRAAKVGEPLPPPPPAVGLQDRGTSPGLAVQEEPSAHGSASVGIELAKDGRPSELPSVVKVAAVRGTARDAQVMVGDVILAFNDRPIDCVADYRAALKQVVPGETVTLKIIRGSRKMRLLVIATKAKKSKAPRRGSSPRLTLHPPGSLSSTSPRSARSISPRRRPAGSRSSTPAPGRPRAPR